MTASNVFLVFLSGGVHAVCHGVAREKSRSAFAAASVQGPAIPRPTGKARSVHSAVGFARYSSLSGKRLLAADERCGERDTEFDTAGIDPRLGEKSLAVEGEIKPSREDDDITEEKTKVSRLTRAAYLSDLSTLPFNTARQGSNEKSWLGC
jgi:hypothetical protein